MKISAWHKKHGDIVHWAGSLERYDIVYMAKVFSFTPDDIQAYQADEIVKGGTGYDLMGKLPQILNVAILTMIYMLSKIKHMVT